jgi:hypothetical protein
MNDLRAIAAWMSDELGYPWDFTTDTPPPRELQVAIAQHQWEDPQERYISQRDFDYDPEQWFVYVAGEAGWVSSP